MLYFRFYALTALVLVLLGSGCANMGYYLQSINGQMQLVNSKRPVTSVLADPQADLTLKKKLGTVLRIREFATKELALPQNDSYHNYVDLKRPFVVWNVFATQEFSVQPKEWCFVFVGCVSYRGYFSKAGAEEFADAKKQEHYDVYVAGVPAYSTLGWLDDPVLNTFVQYPETEVARIIFHELAHQVVYAKNDSVFNESFAVAVEIEGLRRWLTREGTPEQRREFKTQQQRREEFASLILRYRARLDVLYMSAIDITRMRASKAEVFAELKQEYLALKQSWGGYQGYDRWFSHDINNAQLASVATYTQQVPAFQALLAQQQGDMRRFYQEVKRLALLAKDQRFSELESWTGKISDIATVPSTD